MVWPGIAGIVAIALFAAVRLDVTLSVSDDTCTYLRWTQSQSYTGGVRNVVYCDLADGRTIIALASQDWTPPPQGSQLELRVEHLILGTRYRVTETRL